VLDIGLQLVDAPGQVANADHELKRDLSDDASVAPEALLDFSQGVVSTQHASGYCSLGLELVEVPPEPVLNMSPLPDEVLTVVKQQSHVPTRTLELCHRQIWLTERRSSHRKGINGIRLAACPGDLARPASQL